jgi:hypothetical protein
MAVADKLSTHWAFEGFIPREYSGIMYYPQEFHFMCKLGGGVSAVEGEVSTT